MEDIKRAKPHYDAIVKPADCNMAKIVGHKIAEALSDECTIKEEQAKNEQKERIKKYGYGNRR
jgi:hypothetical protein